MRIEELRICRMELIEAILTRIRAWDSGIETGISIIEINGTDIKKIQDYDKEISKSLNKTNIDKNYKQKIDELTSEMIYFLDKIEEEKRILLEEKKQFDKNNDILKIYNPSNFKAAFIDKSV